MSIIADAFRDISPWKKKDETKEERLAKLNRLEEELQYAKKKMMMEEKEMPKKEVEVIKVNKIPDPPKPPEIAQKPVIPVQVTEAEKQKDLTTEERLAILEENLVNILEDINDRLTALERAFIKNKV